MNEYRRALRDYFLGYSGEYINSIQLLSGILSYLGSDFDSAQVANQLLDKYPVLDPLLCLCNEKIADVCGIDSDTAFFISVVAEISMRQQLQSKIGTVLDSPTAACGFFENTYRGAIVEELRLVCLDDALKVVDYEVIARGELNKVSFDCDFLLNRVKASGCSRCIVAHNHPDESNEPSAIDIDVTNSLKRILSDNGAELLDHIIIGDNGAGCMLNGGIDSYFR